MAKSHAVDIDVQALMAFSNLLPSSAMAQTIPQGTRLDGRTIGLKLVRGTGWANALVECSGVLLPFPARVATPGVLVKGQRRQSAQRLALSCEAPKEQSD
jgi:hypothetical protein